MPRTAPTALALAGLALPLAGTVTADAARAAKPSRPDLAVAKVARPAPASVAAGGRLTLRDTTANAGRARAGASATRFYLVTDPRASLGARRASRTDPRTADADVLLEGARAVGRLAAGRSSRARAGLGYAVPAATRAGTYRVLACADDRGDVVERTESDNCRVAPGAVTVTQPAPAPPFTSFNDDLDVLPDTDLERRLLPALGLGCTPAVAPRTFATTKAALKSAKAALTAQVGAPAMAALAASPEARSLAGSRGTALALVAAGNLGGALAAQLRAAELAPRDRDVLVNAAALATSAGLPNEAIALLDGARRANAAPTMPYGPDRRAVAAQVRGMAELQRGRTAQAERLLASVPGLDPVLEAESSSGEANAAVCKKDNPLAIRKMKRSTKRNPGPVKPLDESTGRSSRLRGLQLPAFPRQAAMGRPHFDDLGKAQALAEADAINAAEDAVAARLRGRKVSPAEKRRADLVQRRINAVYKRPEMKAIQDEAFRATDAADEVKYAFFGNAEQENRYADFSKAASEACRGAKDWDACHDEQMRQTCTPAMRGAHQTWLGHVQRSRDASARYVAATSKAVSGLAANLDDPDLRESIRIGIWSVESAHHLLTVRNLQGWSHYAVLYFEECVESPQGMPADDGSAVGADGAPGIEGPEACNAASKQLNFVFDVSKLVGLDAKLPKLKVNCERIQVSYEFGPSSWAQAFAQVDWKYRAGSVTAFVGVRGKVEFQSHNEQLKAGVYLTATKNGVEDLGWRMSPSTTRPLGPVMEITTKTDWDLSFVPAFQDLGALVSGS